MVIFIYFCFPLINARTTEYEIRFVVIQRTVCSPHIRARERIKRKKWILFVFSFKKN